MFVSVDEIVDDRNDDVFEAVKTVTLTNLYRQIHAATLLKVNVEIFTFSGRSQGLSRGRNISSFVKGRIVLPL